MYKFKCNLGWTNKKIMVFLVDAMQFKFKPNLSGVGLDLA
jgi:hypothetical protein